MAPWWLINADIGYENKREGVRWRYINGLGECNLRGDRDRYLGWWADQVCTNAVEFESYCVKYGYRFTKVTAPPKQHTTA